MPKKTMKKDIEECGCDEHEHECTCCCPIGKFFCHADEHMNQKEMPEFVEHFMTAKKEMLMGVRDMIDWKIEKIEKRSARIGKRRVKKVDIK